MVASPLLLLLPLMTACKFIHGLLLRILLQPDNSKEVGGIRREVLEVGDRMDSWRRGEPSTNISRSCSMVVCNRVRHATEGSINIFKW